MRIDFTPVFSGGTGRSGTTAIVNCLTRHPEFHTSMPREIKYLTDRAGLLDLNFGRPLAFETSRREVRNRVFLRTSLLLGKSKHQVFRERISTRWWSQEGKTGKPRGLVQGIEREDLNRALERFDFKSKEDLLGASQDLFFELSRAQLKDQSVKYFADSTPLNIQNANRISRFMPNSLFINMVCDGRDVALSVSKEKWGPSTPEEALEWWKGRIEKSFLALKKIPEDNHITVRLEDFIVHDRDATYRKVLTFLNLDDNDTLRKYYDEVLLAEKMSQGDWAKVVKNPNAFERRYSQILQELYSQGIEIEQYY
jgi:hypothetical protein